MTEKIFTITDIEPIDLLGVNNKILKTVEAKFPSLKIVSRGRTLKLVGKEELIDEFIEKIKLMTTYFLKYNTLTEGDIENILGEMDMKRSKIQKEI